MTEPDRATSVDFDPVPLRPRGSRRFDPALAGVLVVVLALGLAILKPWGGVSGDRTSAGDAASGSPAPAVTNPPGAPDRPTAATDPREAVRYLSVLRTRDSWGVRAVIASPGHPDLAERWVAADSRRRAGGPDLTTRLDASGNEVLALGVTTPADTMPIAIRAYRIGSDGEPTWLDARRVASDLPAGEHLLLPPSIDGVATRVWPAGDYRIDLLMGTWIEQLSVQLDRAAAATDGNAGPSSPSLQPRGPDRAAMPPAWLGNVPAGVFAVVDGVVLPLPGEPGTRLDAAAAWLDVATGDRAGEARRVASTWHAGAARIGVMLPGGAHEASGTLRRLTPGSTPDVRLAQIGDRVDASNNPTAFLLFRTADGEAWPAGTYALEATWDGPGGRRAATWHLELTPGPLESETNMMAAARVFGPFAGRDGLLIGSTEQLRDPQRAASLQPRPIEVDPAAPGRSLRTIGCEGASIDARPPVIGLAYPVDRVPSSVEVTVLGPFDRPNAVRLRSAIDVVPGLTLLAPGRGSTFSDGVYRISIRDDRGVRELRVCIGTSPYNG